MTSDSYWVIPNSIDLDKLLEKDRPIFFGKKVANQDNFYYVIDYILEKSLTEDLSQTLGYVELYSVDLQKNMAHNYKDYFTYLIKHHVIERAPWEYSKSDPENNIKGKCFGFRLGFKYENFQDLKKVKILGAVHKKKRKNRIKTFLEEQASIKKKYHSFTKWFELLEIDMYGCNRWIDSTPDYQLPMGGIRGYRKGKAKKPLKRIKALYSIERIHLKNFHFTVDDSVGRFHSNLTNLKSELRNYLTWNGHKLVSVDIKNSQPLLSLLLFRSDWYSTSSSYLSIFQFPSIPNPLISKYNPNGLIDLIPPTAPLHFFVYYMLEEFSLSIEYQDITEYKRVVESGNFYREMHKLIFSDHATFDKAKMKEVIFQVFYSDNRFFHQDGTFYDKKTKSWPDAEPKRLFEKAFPSVYKVFFAYKTIDNSFLPRLLQQIESTLILKHIVPRIASERPDLPIFTIHDSVVTLVGEEGFVEQVMREEIMRLTGLTPKFGIERWEPQNQSDESVTE
jgi:hypothetical protein